MAKLLVVEADARQRAVYREVFENARHQVIEAESASEAVDVCMSEHPDLVLLDPHLGRFLGLSKGKWVADASHRCGTAPVVVIAEESECEEMEKLGPDAVVAKDMPADELIETVTSLLKA